MHEIIEFGTPVYIKWLDSANNDTGWRMVSSGDVVVGNPETIGFAVYSNEDVIAITHSLCKGHAYNVFTIPLGCIEEMRIINASKEQVEGKQPRKKNSKDGRELRPESEKSLGQ